MRDQAAKRRERSTAAGQTTEFIELFEQVERQGASRQVDPKILLQPDRCLHPFDCDGGEAPFPSRGAFRGDNPFFDHLVDDFGVDAAEPAEVGQGASGFFVQYHAVNI